MSVAFVWQSLQALLPHVTNLPVFSLLFNFDVTNNCLRFLFDLNEVISFVLGKHCELLMSVLYFFANSVLIELYGSTIGIKSVLFLEGLLFAVVLV